jgi:hypothetical protein
VFVVSHLLKWIGQDVDPAFLRSVTNADAYSEIARHKEIAHDIFRLDDDVIQVRSSVFAEYLILNHLSSDEIVDSIYPIIVEAVKRKADRRYQAILSSLMRFPILDRALQRDENRLGSLIDLFDRLHRDIDVNQEPLFWLQYSILMTAANDLVAAESFIRTAYARASANIGFQTFQIDTYALRLLLLIEQRKVNDGKISRFGDIVDKMQKVRAMINDESRRVHAIEVLDGIEPFVKNRLMSFSIAEKNVLVYHLDFMVRALESLSPDDRAQTGSDAIKEGINRARNSLIA